MFECPCVYGFKAKDAARNKKNKDMREADDYSSVFMECADMDVKVNVVFTEVQEKSHQLAKQKAKSLLTVDTLDNFEED